MSIDFDPETDERNIAKHGLSLARAADMRIIHFIEDDRNDYGETRYRAWGLIDGRPHCMVFTNRGDGVRVISLRRTHIKEFNRYVPRSDF